jgi:cytoskeletal protein CcmA (bactofilin family)
MPEIHDGTVIAADTVIKGEMAVENRARILGRFEGTIRSKGQVEVADKGTCKAAVEANTVQVDGSVEGNITANDKVQLNATARMTGDLMASKLVVTEGAAFTGHVTVGPNAMKGRAGQPGGGDHGHAAPAASGDGHQHQHQQHQPQHGGREAIAALKK